MKFKKIKLTITIVIGIVVLSYAFWVYYLKPAILWDQTYWGNMLELRCDISAFKGKFGRLPTSLEEMVSAGVLPEKSNITFIDLSQPTHNPIELKKLF